MKKILRRSLWVLLVLLVIAQAIRPTKNESTSASLQKVSDEFQTPDEVVNILETSCNDCHSNNTFYPWYAEIQPVGWWLADHVNEGKEHLNFDLFRSYPPEEQHHAMEELMETVQEDEMPLSSYTFMHKDAVLSASQKTALISWAQGIMTQLETSYPGLKEGNGEGKGAEGGEKDDD